MLPKIGEYRIAYDDVRLADYFIVRGVDMPFIPPITINELTIDGNPGAWNIGRNIGTRDIVIRLGILNATRKLEEALDKWINRAQIVSKDHECKLDLGDGYYVYAMLTGNTDITRNGHWSIADLTFHCSDPRIYRFTYELPLASGLNKVTILGNCPVRPRFQITRPSNPFLLQKENTQKYVRVNGLTTSQIVVIDLKDHKCTVNDTYKAIDPSVTTWWELEPGYQEIRLNTGSGTMTYTEAYL